jgi:hypothetical protein
MGRKKKRALVDEQLRAAIRSSGLTVYRLAKLSGIGDDRIHRFLQGIRTLTLPAAAKVCDVLGLELTQIRPPADDQAEGR